MQPWSFAHNADLLIGYIVELPFTVLDVCHNTLYRLVRNINVPTMPKPNATSLTLAALARAEVKVIRSTLITCTTNHIRLAGTLPSISVAFFIVVRS